MAIHPLQASPAVAETAFAFLVPLGFTCHDRWVSGGESFKDGWSITFLGPKIQVIVQYLDVQFEVRFVRGELGITYLEIDRDLFDRRSGFHGNMFPPQKLEAAIEIIATDIRENYGPTLLGDEGTWDSIARLKATPPRVARIP